jgi:hypothetical protein
MRRPGRKSAASLSVSPISAEPRLRAPEGLSEAEVDLFLSIVSKLPASYFEVEASEQLANYCRHSIAARDLSRMISRFNPKWLSRAGGLERYGSLLKLRERESRAALAHARSLRLTNQARIDPRMAGRRADGAPAASYYDTMDLGDFDD